MLRVESVARSFGAQTVLRNISFDLPTSGLAGLIGPGGGGKSTLLKIIGKTVKPDHGVVSFLENGLSGGSGSEPSVSLMFQEGALFDSSSVFDNVAFPLVAGRVPTSTLGWSTRVRVRDQVSEILARVGLTKAAYKYPGQLSGGMRRRVALARALVGRPKYLFLDDPTAGLDPVASSVIMELILELHRDYRPTTIIVSHDLRRLLPVVDVVYGLFGGVIAFQGRLDDLRCCQDQAICRFVSCRYDFERPAA